MKDIEDITKQIIPSKKALCLEVRRWFNGVIENGNTHPTLATSAKLATTIV